MMMDDTSSEAKYRIEKNYFNSPIKFGEVYLVQIGQTHCTNHFAVNEHLHLNWFELTRVLDGKGETITNGGTVPIKAGELYLSFPGDLHTIRSNKESPIKYQYLSFWTENEDLQQQLEAIMMQNIDPERRIFTDKNIEYLIQNCLSETLLNDGHSVEIITCTLNQLLHYIFRAFTSKKQQSSLNIGSSEELCYQLMNYIGTHIYILEGLNELAGHFGYSYSYLSALFSKTTGDTLMNYYSMRRLDAAVMLLKEGKLSVSEIAELLKYSSIYTFSRAFKNRFGISPAEFRKKEILL